jgi:phage tail sheath protein FI
MPEYLAPGVFVEEVSFRAKSIEGVGTSVAAIVGPTRFGPTRGKPEVVTSFGEFARVYGDTNDLEFTSGTVLNHTAIAAKAFFDGGGKQLYVARVANLGADATASVADTNGDVTFRARFPGEMGNLTLEVEWRDSENLLRTTPTSAPDDGETVYLVAAGLTEDDFANVTLPGTLGATLSVRAVVRRDGENYEILRPFIANDGTNTETVTVGATSRIEIEDMAGRTLQFTRVTLKPPATGSLDDGTSARIVLSEQLPTDAELFTLGGGTWGTNRVIYGVIDTEAAAFSVSGAPTNPGVTAFDLPLAALAAAPANVRAILAQRAFDLSVHSGGPNGPVIYTYGNLTTAQTGPTSLATVLTATPQKRYDQLTSPVSCEFGDGVDGAAVLAALLDLFDDAAMNPTGITADEPRFLITLDNGSDGDVPNAVQYGGVEDEVNGSTGLVALEDIEDVSIVMTPAAAATTDGTLHQAVVAEVQKHCRKMRYRIGIVDSRDGMSLAEVREFRSNFDDSRLALYYPWVVIADPRGIDPTVTVPPGGFIAGVYANTDVQRGVHKPPANEPVIGALRFAQDINRFQQELLNPDGINCLRSFPNRGHRVWGGRTLSSDPEWKYVNVRRYFLYLERSIDKSTQWVVFEPNGEALWANVQATVESFLYNEWRNGRLLGSEKTAFFVRCDRSTMTQNDIDNGRLVCEVGVAALKPAEFVIFRIGQKTADA